MSGDRFYSDQEAEQILRLAANNSADGVSRERLMQMAEELGLSPEAVAQAEEVVRTKGAEIRERQEFDLFQRRSFFNHFMSYLIVNGALIGFNLVQAHRITWAMWPVIGWGIGVAMQASHSFLRGSEGYEEDFEEWRAKKNGSKTVNVDLLPHVESIVLRENLNKIETIRRLREETGAQLVDAKNAVEAFERQHPGSLRL